jgi:hypothetical protein
MKRADAKIQLMSSYPAQKLLEQSGRGLAFVCPHEYTRDLVGAEKSLNQLSKWIDTIPGCSHLKIGITEWNVSGGDWGLMRGRQMTLETALANARHLHLMMRHSDKVTIANRSNLANSFCGAVIETNPSAVLLRPSYHVMRLYARHFKPLPLKVESTPGNVDVFACASEDKQSVTIFAVNSQAKPVRWNWKLDGFAKPMKIKSVDAVLDTKDNRQPDVMNHWTAPDRVRTVALQATPDVVELPALSVVAVDAQER